MMDVTMEILVMMLMSAVNFKCKIINIYSFRNHIHGLVSQFLLMVLMILINFLQFKYIDKHFVTRKFSFAREKSKILIATAIFVSSLTYRVIYNFVLFIEPNELTLLGKYE